MEVALGDVPGVVGDAGDAAERPRGGGGRGIGRGRRGRLDPRRRQHKAAPGVAGEAPGRAPDAREGAPDGESAPELADEREAVEGEGDSLFWSFFFIFNIFFDDAKERRVRTKKKKKGRRRRRDDGGDKRFCKNSRSKHKGAERAKNVFPLRRFEKKGRRTKKVLTTRQKRRGGESRRRCRLVALRCGTTFWRSLGFLFDVFFAPAQLPGPRPSAPPPARSGVERR